MTKGNRLNLHCLIPTPVPAIKQDGKYRDILFSVLSYYPLNEQMHYYFNQAIDLGKVIKTLRNMNLIKYS